MSPIEERALTLEEMEQLRSKAAQVLEKLHQDLPSTPPSTSWLGTSESNGISARFFNHYGFMHIPNFWSRSEEMKDEMTKMVEQEWHPEKKTESFSTTAKGNEERGDYFLDSSNRVSFFAEPCALEEEGTLKAEFKSPRSKIQALNKIGHAVHLRSGSIFYDYAKSDNVRQLVLSQLGYQDPVVPQSMYIVKSIGGAVSSHQDSSFLYTTPKQSCLGLWLALDDAKLENGCLWVRPKSHLEPVRRQFVRNPKYFTQSVIDNVDDGNDNNVGRGDLDAPKLIFQNRSNDNNNIAWEGTFPPANSPMEWMDAHGFVPIECQAGDLLAFCGELDHFSLPNFSTQQRHTFQLHLVEGPEAGVEWSKSNWLQYPKNEPFMKLQQSS